MTDVIKNYINSHQDRFIEELQEYLRFPSVSAQRSHDADCRACAQWLQQHFQSIGLDCSLEDQGGQPIVVARKKGKSDKRVVIYGHYDVQPEDPLDQWQTQPFEPIIKDEIIYARGATDDKGQLWAHVKAVEAILNTDGELPCEVVFLLEGEEESGGDALGRYVRGPGKDLNPDAVVISDGDMYDETTPAITYGLRGILAFEVTVKGRAFDLHSGAYGGAVANPAMMLVRMLSQCVSPDGKILIPGFYDAVRPISDWEAENIRSLDFNDELLLRDTQSPALHGEPGYNTLERLWARPTFEINGIYGGYQGQHSKTIIPAHATAKISVRLVPEQSPEHIRDLIFDYLRSICPDSVTLDLTYTASGPPVVYDVTTPAMQAAQAALQSGFNADAKFIRTGGSIPIVSTFSDQWHCPVILMGLGLDSDGPHSPNEHFSLKNFFKGIQASVDLFGKLGT